jgi:FkbM family methyltransferase
MVMTAGDRIIAEGADRYRRPGIVERLAMRLSKLALGPSIRQPLKRIYLRALTLQTRGKGLPASLPGGETVRVLPEYGFLSWNPDEYRAFRDAVRPGMTALDVGANVGAYSLLLGRWVGASGAVFAFEPAPDAYDGLQRHIHLNALDAIVTPVRAAVGAAPATAPFVVGATAGESRLATPTDDDARTVAVPVTTLDEFCAREHLTPDFIKIDVEGAELDVLRGARDTIRRTRGRLSLFVEMHPSIWRSSGLRADDVRAELDFQQLDVVPLTAAADPWAIEGACLRLVPRS